MLDSEQIIEEFFWWQRRTFRTQAECAEHFGVSSAYISGVINGKRNLTARMLNEIGYKKITGYVKVD